MRWKFWETKDPAVRVPRLADAVWYEGRLYRVMSLRKDGVVEFASDHLWGGSDRLIQSRVKMHESELVFEEARQFWLAVNRPGRLYHPDAE